MCNVVSRNADSRFGGYKHTSRADGKARLEQQIACASSAAMLACVSLRASEFARSRVQNQSNG